MTYQSGFVLAVKNQKGDVLRESGGNVYLPFHEEYSLLLKNNNGGRASANVKIDGTDVLGGSELIIPSYGSVSLERFMVNGDLNSGRKFKFVPLSDSRVQDPTSHDNGLVEVTFWQERVQPIFIGNSYQPHIYYCDSGSSGQFTADMSAIRCCASSGATVEGEVSKQAFTTIHGFTKGGVSTTLRLRILSCDASVTVKETRTLHCTVCGRKVKFNDTYCGGCGHKIDK